MKLIPVNQNINPKYLYFDVRNRYNLLTSMSKNQFYLLSLISICRFIILASRTDNRAQQWSIPCQPFFWNNSAVVYGSSGPLTESDIYLLNLFSGTCFSWRSKVGVEPACGEGDQHQLNHRPGFRLWLYGGSKILTVHRRFSHQDGVSKKCFFFI
jgi:hypothetical protein